MRLFSFSSQVVLGHVGNSALVVPLARLGVELLALPSVLFSNHLGYGTAGGSDLPDTLLNDVLEGLQHRGLPQGLDAVLSGFLGQPGKVTLLAAWLRRWRREVPDLPYLLDPVMGDGHPGEAGRLYVDPSIPPLLRSELLPQADWLTPNPFELSLLVRDGPARDSAAIKAQAESLLVNRCRGVLVTSFIEEERIGALLVTRTGAWRVLTPHLDFAVTPNGGGDLLAGLFLVELLRLDEPLAAATLAVARLHAVLSETWRRGSRELVMTGDQTALLEGEGAAVAVLPFP